MVSRGSECIRGDVGGSAEIEVRVAAWAVRGWQHSMFKLILHIPELVAVSADGGGATGSELHGWRIAGVSGFHIPFPLRHLHYVTTPYLLPVHYFPFSMLQMPRKTSFSLALFPSSVTGATSSLPTS